MSLSYCPKQGRPCVRFVERYFKDCLCDVNDGLSFACGIVSLVCWGVAEVPQIVTNFKTKSSHGVSLAFLLTWVAGDVFNLVGCVLEPVTLPTQYYTALLYTISTIVLVIQIVYYDHFYRWSKKRCRTNVNNREVDEEKKPLKHGSTNISSGIPILKASTPFYFTSARSLASSGTPPFRSYMRVAKSGPSAMGLDCYSSSDDDDESAHVSVHATTQPRPIPRSVGYGTFLATSLNLPFQGKALTEIYVGFSGRRLLQEHGSSNNVYGQWLGWLMAAIYMGGRLPQIWLNIKRGSVEGLNPLMFIFALVANVTYVGSIVIRTTEWGKIKANMPWLLDAVVCVVLDLFIILQYVYYRYSKNRRASERQNYGDYMEATKNVVS